MNTQSAPRSFATRTVATLALLVFATLGSACEFNSMPQPGRTNSDDMRIAPAPATIPCSPPTAIM